MKRLRSLPTAMKVSVGAAVVAFALVLHAVWMLLGSAAAELAAAAVLVYVSFVASTVARPLPARHERKPKSVA